MGKVTFLYYLLFKGNHVLEATCDKKTRNVTFLILFLNKLDFYNIMVFRTYFLSFGIHLENTKESAKIKLVIIPDNLRNLIDGISCCFK